MSARKIRNSWWIDLRFRGTRLRKRSPDNSKAGAQAFEGLLRQKLARGESIEPKKIEVKEMTFGTFAKIWLEKYARVNNRASELQNKNWVLDGHLLPFFGSLLLSEVQTKIVEEYKAQKLASGLAPKTINNHLAILRKCLTTAVDWDLLPSPPRFKFLRNATQKFRFLSPKESEILLQTTPTGYWRTLVLTAMKTGMRISELLALSWEDVDLPKNQICIRRGIVRGKIAAPKNYRTRYLPLTHDVCEALAQLPRVHELVFTYRGDYLRYDNARTRLQTFCQLAGIPVVSWHTLRHTYASNLVAKGAPLKAVQDLLGHSTINMTMRYSHLSQESLRDAVSLLEPEKPDIWATGGQHAENTLQKILQDVAF